MLSTPPECGTPCGLTEALAHDNARLKAENARLKAENARLTEEVEAHAHSLSPAMVQARNDQLNAEVARLESENARLKRAIDAATDIGIYARAVIAHDGTRKERAEWQEGWNAAQIRASEAVRQALEAP